MSLNFKFFPVLALCLYSPTTFAETKPVDVVKAYYAAYNAKNLDKQTALMSPDVIYEPNQGEKMSGPAKYREYVEGTFKTIDEKCVDLVVYSSPNSKKLIAESYAVGKYIKDIDGYPKAKGQSYRTHVVEVFEIAGSKIKSLTTYYNEKDWLSQISK